MRVKTINKYDLIVVGGGIVGLACAYAAAKRKARVVVLERDRLAQGASIRNFGMIWPIGQPAGDRLQLALESRAIWLEASARFAIPLRPCGSIHVAHFEDEWQLLQEFAAGASHDGFQIELATPEQVCQRSPAVNPQGLKGGLFSATECGVDPPQCIAQLTTALADQYGVEIHQNTQVISIKQSQALAADGRSWAADRIIVASGTDVQTLYPGRFSQAAMRRCKLHMLATEPQPIDIGTHLASGLTLRHYATFEHCASLALVKRRVAEQWPELDQLGIHVMMSQPQDGRVILGDSHQYDEAIAPFENAHIDQLILDQLQRVFRLPNWRIARRWTGYYLKHPQSLCYVDAPESNVRLVTGLGGNGMTLSMGVGQRLWSTFDNPRIL